MLTDADDRGRVEEMAARVPRFFAVAKDPETYSTTEGPDIVALWKELFWFEPEDADPDEVEQFRCFAIDPDNWRLDDWGKPAILVWQCGGESNGTITFYRIDHENPLAAEVTRLTKELADARAAFQIIAEIADATDDDGGTTWQCGLVAKRALTEPKEPSK